jgi:hypothetical protein
MIGAPEEIRTPDPQIRSLVLYPAELRALAPGNDKTPRCQPYPPGDACGVASNRSIWMASPVMSGQVFRASTAEWGLMLGALPLRQAVTGAWLVPRPSQSAIFWLEDRSLHEPSSESGWLKAPGLVGEMGFQARRAPRRSLSSTARSGIVSRKVAPIVPSTSRISPPWARTSSAAMARPRPVPPARVDP